ncbi:MAG TPA: surface-adhesin E family protein [Allosphingosinicella sp.]
MIVGMSSSAALAADWVEVSRAENGMITYYDAESVRVTGNTLRVWLRRDLSRVRTERARESRQQWEVDCVDRTESLLTFVDYGPDGRVIASQTIPAYSRRVNAIVPDTVGETIANAVCAASGLS